ncbi:unnamed protein product, partial [Mesorhabditis belari]|uniref:RING-type domain-containing protein n=1 Tax=Mesorhabditis belari TaxID=2138241 RepID=A0AAF3F9Z5_9BILA
MESQSRIFHSLNCSLCKKPFSNSVSDPKSPRHLSCGVAVCKLCWDIEKPIEKANRTHKCSYQWECFNFDVPVYYLLEILDHPSIAAAQNEAGYLLSKVMKTPECPVCREEYVIDLEQRKPYDLCCRHAVCNRCFLELSTSSNDPEFPWHVVCPICKDNRRHAMKSRKNQLQDFLRELPEMLKELKLNATKKCYKCQTEKLINELFYCKDCQKKICESCNCSQHQNCETVSYSIRRIEKIRNDLQKNSFPQIDDHERVFREKYEKLLRDIEDFKEKMSLNLDHFENSELSEALDRQEKLKKNLQKLEHIAEKFLSHFRIFDTEMQVRSYEMGMAEELIS